MLRRLARCAVNPEQGSVVTTKPDPRRNERSVEFRARRKAKIADLTSNNVRLTGALVDIERTTTDPRSRAIAADALARRSDKETK